MENNLNSQPNSSKELLTEDIFLLAINVYTGIPDKTPKNQVNFSRIKLQLRSYDNTPPFTSTLIKQCLWAPKKPKGVSKLSKSFSTYRCSPSYRYLY